MNTYGLGKIKTFDQLLLWLKDNLGWPIDEMEIEKEPFEDITFEYDPVADLGLKAQDVAHFREIFQLRPFVSNQPWGIFFISFEDKKIPVGVLKRVLGGLTLKKRQSANKPDQKGWSLHDLLFISAHGESGERELSFLNFAEENEGKKKIILKELGWDQNDTNLKLAYVANTLRDRLTWPEDENDSDSWRKNWANAFTSQHGKTISTAKDLTKRLGVLATKIRQSVNEVIAVENSDGPLAQIYENFKQTLFHNLDHDGFADMYAQTICYGLLAARIMRSSGGLVADDAALVAPLTQPFLKDLMETFLAVGGRKNKIDFNELGINEVVDALHHSDMEAVLRDFGNKNPNEDPIIHFYEYFLKEYDSIMREQRGVYYTPLPVVKFIVRNVDETLEKEFGLKDGLADTATWGDMNAHNNDITLPEGVSAEDPFVQILDPAVGTGTFLVEVIDLIEKRMKNKWRVESRSIGETETLWNEYVQAHLLPRLNGFEMMMAPYAIAHIKIGLKLAETGYKPNDTAHRVHVYLTNTLEEPTGLGQQTNMRFITDSLADEARGADHIKANTFITVVLGNPPYSGESANKDDWIMDLMEDYKKEPGGKEKLKERNPKWINDDYVKFIRYGQHFIEKNGSGVLAFINPHGFLDNPTFRGMRWNLLKTYDKIHTIDLHGNTRKKDVCPDGSADKNVFDIMQGVAITFFVKTGKKKEDELGEVFHYDLFGKRDFKYNFLTDHSLRKIKFEQLAPKKTLMFFVPKNEIGKEEYEKGFKIDELFSQNSPGVVTARDAVVIDMDENNLLNRINKFTDTQYSDEEIRQWLFPNKKPGKYLAGDSSGWKLTEARNKILDNDHKTIIRDIDYRPFDTRKIYYSPDMVDRGRQKYMKHFLKGENIGLALCKQFKTGDQYVHAFISNKMIESSHVSNRTSEITSCFSLYLYPENSGQLAIGGTAKRTPNLKQEIVDEIAEKLGLTFTNEKNSPSGGEEFSPIDILDYIYAVLHSPIYREKYKEFLKIDFPRVPYPKDKDTFWALVKLGGEIRQIHLLESPTLENSTVAYPHEGSDIIERTIVKKDWELYEGGKLMRIWINDQQQCFEGIPLVAWEFYIGGYQPAQLWLKKRKGCTLSFDNIQHYKKIIVALTETDRLMGEIDKVYSPA